MEIYNSTVTSILTVIHGASSTISSEGHWLTAISVSAFVLYKFCSGFFKQEEKQNKDPKPSDSVRKIYGAILKHNKAITETNFKYIKGPPFFILLKTIAKCPIPKEDEEEIKKEVTVLWDLLFENIYLSPDNEKNNRLNGEQQEYIRNLISINALQVPDYLKPIFKVYGAF